MVKCRRHGLAGNLGGTIEVLVVEGMIFRHRLLDGIAVNRSRGRIDQPLDVVGDAGFQDVESAANIDVESRARKFMALQ